MPSLLEGFQAGQGVFGGLASGIESGMRLGMLRDQNKRAAAQQQKTMDLLDLVMAEIKKDVGGAAIGGEITAEAAQAARQQQREQDLARLLAEQQFLAARPELAASLSPGALTGRGRPGARARSQANLDAMSADTRKQKTLLEEGLVPRTARAVGSAALAPVEAIAGGLQSGLEGIDSMLALMGTPAVGALLFGDDDPGTLGSRTFADLFSGAGEQAQARRKQEALAAAARPVGLQEMLWDPLTSISDAMTPTGGSLLPGGAPAMPPRTSHTWPWDVQRPERPGPQKLADMLGSSGPFTGYTDMALPPGMSTDDLLASMRGMQSGALAADSLLGPPQDQVSSRLNALQMVLDAANRTMRTNAMMTFERALR